MIKSALIPPVLFVRWQERCEAADVEMIKRLTEQAHGTVGERLVYVAIIPVGIPPPDTAIRAALRDGTQHAAQLCPSIHIVIEGGGLRRALIRSVSAGLMLASRLSFQIHARVDEALAQARSTGDFDIDAVLREAKNVGVLTDP